MFHDRGGAAGAAGGSCSLGCGSISWLLDSPTLNQRLRSPRLVRGPISQVLLENRQRAVPVAVSNRCHRHLLASQLGRLPSDDARRGIAGSSRGQSCCPGVGVVIADGRRPRGPYASGFRIALPATVEPSLRSLVHELLMPLISYYVGLPLGSWRRRWSCQTPLDTERGNGHETASQCSHVSSLPLPDR